MSRTYRRPGSILARLDATAARRWAVLARAALARRRAEIDALNVFPVPDGDTGTNMYLTFDSALDAARAEREARGGTGPEPTLAASAASLARAALLAARGNSGVILSQLVRGLSEVVGDPAGRHGIDGAALARALRRASDLAYASVTRPVEGTILTVAAAAAGAAEAAAEAAGSLHEVTTSAVAAAREALARTTSQLPALQRAGVVDAGAAGYVLLLEALQDVVAGNGGHAAEGSASLRGAAWPAQPSAPEPDGPDGPDQDYDGPAYEVMYLLSDSDEAAVSTLRGRLDELGESLLVVGGPDLWNVHVHVDDAGAAVEAGVAAGRPHRIRVAHLANRHPQRAGAPASEVAVVACVAGDGLAEVMRRAGAVPVPSGPGRRASTGQLLTAVRETHALSVLVLPNDNDTQLAAQAAASAAAEEGIEVLVVRSRAAVQGIAALAVFDPTQGARDNLLAMSSAAAATRHGAVTVATRDALTSAGWCRTGDVLGVVDDDIAVVGDDLALVAADVVRRLLGSGGELLTVVIGADAPAGLGDAAASAARSYRRDVEVSLLVGDQPAYPLLLGVE